MSAAISCDRRRHACRYSSARSFRQKFVAVERGVFRRKTVAGDVFGHYAREQEVQKIIVSTGFGAAAAHFESTEWVAADDRTSA